MRSYICTVIYLTFACGLSLSLVITPETGTLLDKILKQRERSHEVDVMENRVNNSRDYARHLAQNGSSKSMKFVTKHRHASRIQGSEYIITRKADANNSI